MVLLAGVAVEAVTRRLAADATPVRRAAVAVALVAVPLLHLVYLERAILFTATPRQVGRALYGMRIRSASPAMTVIGLLRSCETVFTNSFFIRSRFFKSVMSRSTTASPTGSPNGVTT